MKTPDLYPLRFDPRYVPKIWGGERFKTRLGRALPPGEKIGESWEIYDRGDDSAVVSEGPLKGQRLGDLVKEYGPRLLGSAVWEKSPDRFPLLIKFIDASDWLSVQVHPDDDWAASHVDPDEPGKTEMWYMLDCEEGSQLIAGLKKGTTRAEFKQALAKGELDRVLNRFVVKGGDSVFLPAGRVHAIGKGCLLAEVQQNSDTTYRVFDFNRLENGQARELHVQQGIETIRFDEAMQALPDLAPLPLACPYFRVDNLHCDSTFAPSTDGLFSVLIGIKGEGTILTSGREGITLRPGRSLLLPASVDWRLEPTGNIEALWVRPGAV